MGVGPQSVADHSQEELAGITDKGTILVGEVIPDVPWPPHGGAEGFPLSACEVFRNQGLVLVKERLDAFRKADDVVGRDFAGLGGLRAPDGGHRDALEEVLDLYGTVRAENG